MDINIAVVIATLLGPIFAVQAQKAVERHQERRRAKDHIFKTLMATRAATLSGMHVQALNMIELEFSQNSWYEFWSKHQAKKVLEQWRAYHAHLYGRDTDRSNPAEVVAWNNRSSDLLIDLLYAMSSCLGYPFDKTQIKTSWYSPVAHGEVEVEEKVIRRGVAEIVAGKRALPVSTFFASDEEANAAAATQELVRQWLAGKLPTPVVVQSTEVSARATMVGKD